MTLAETETYETGIYQLEITDPVIGGPDGIDNLQAKQLANRTNWLKAKIDSILGMSFIHTAVAENPGDTDEFGYWDSLTLSLRKVTLTNLKNTIFASKPSGENLLINSNGLVNQLGYVSGTATTVANQYTIDMFRVVTSGQNLTFSTTNGVTTFTAPAGGVDLPIENKNILGGSYVLSFTGTATAVVSQSADNITYTTITPSGGVYDITGRYYVRVRLSNGTFSKPKFEEGVVPTPYGLKSIEKEQSDCEKHLPVFKSTSTVSFLCAGAIVNPSLGYALIPFKVPTRVPPTGIVLSSPTHLTISGVSAGAASAAGMSSVSNDGANINLTVTGQTVGSGVVYFNSPTAYLYFTGCQL